MYDVYTRINFAHIRAYRVALRLVTPSELLDMPNGIGQAYH